MRWVPILVVAVVAGCARVPRTGPPAVVPQWSCEDGRVSCWNATRQDVSSGFSNGEATCAWSCARYEGATTALTLRVRPLYGYPSPSRWPDRWACEVRAVETRAACGTP